VSKREDKKLLISYSKIIAIFLFCNSLFLFSLFIEVIAIKMVITVPIIPAIDIILFNNNVTHSEYLK
ncbi:hypothetical protein LI063_10845, partial [Clostridium perfringens]|uniref:hypothetical protein n=1 Tax=Clostridium perfringens TaxID=1502 RepID=UPI002245CEA0